MKVYKVFNSENKYIGEVEAASPTEAITLFRKLTGNLFETTMIVARIKTDRRKTVRKGTLPR